ncbi:MAG: HNH endonuclease signature motif containing protein, partial [Iamia sp.]
GADITTITSNRRHIPAALRTALEARDHECVVPGCHTTRGLQVDHITDFHKGGPTALWNNALLCVYHHYLKTHCRWTLRGPPGHWTFTPPDTS